MKKYRAQRRSQRIPRRVWWLLIGLTVILIVGSLAVWQKYNNDLKPVSDNQTTQIFTVESGSSVNQIADNLEKAGLIRSAWAMELYTHRKDLGTDLKAGTYALSPSQDLPSVVATLTRGEVATRLVTILPGRRIDQVRADLINSGFTPAAVDSALEPGQYSDMPVLAFKPANVDNLEGLLWPESFQKQPDTDPSTVIRQSLQLMGERLTPDIQAAFAAQGLTTYQGITLASIIIQEVSKPSGQAQVAQVFLSRLKSNMPLGADPTARYGAVLAGKGPSLTYGSVYNTHNRKGLPPTPISTINAASLNAAAHPAATNWLFFVSGDNGTTYFSTNLQDHEKLTEQHCRRLCGR